MNNNMMQAMLSMVKAGQNPNMLAQQILQQNPRFNAIMNQVKQSGMSMEQYTRQYAKQNGIDIDSLMRQFGQGGRK